MIERISIVSTALRMAIDEGTVLPVRRSSYSLRLYGRFLEGGESRHVGIDLKQTRRPDHRNALKFFCSVEDEYSSVQSCMDHDPCCSIDIVLCALRNFREKKRSLKSSAGNCRFRRAGISTIAETHSLRKFMKRKHHRNNRNNINQFFIDSKSK